MDKINYCIYLFDPLNFLSSSTTVPEPAARPMGGHGTAGLVTVPSRAVPNRVVPYWARILPCRAARLASSWFLQLEGRPSY